MKSNTSFRSLPFILAASLLAFSACNADDDDPVVPTGGGTPTSGVPSGDHAVFTLDGQTITVTASGTNVLSAFSSSASNSIYQEKQGTTVTSITGIPQHPLAWARVKEIDVSTSLNNHPTDVEIESLFNVQSYPFGKSLEVVGAANAEDGVIVTYFDPVTNVSWSTDRGTANQTGSTFTIVSKTAIANPSGFGKYNIHAQFSCKLYDGNGNVKTLTNGSMRGRAVLFY